jgi:phosphoribosylformylglycinamidine cyclo-ligase
MTWPAPSGGLLAATMDGVGTKLHLAKDAERLDQAAADLVYHCANDLLVHGARPVAFLDYVAQSKLEPEAVASIVTGLARACREVGCALLGGETAEMPDTYLDRAIDVAGCMIGALAESELLDGRDVRSGDVLLGLGSVGLHTNGFSLARRVLRASGRALADPLPTDPSRTLADALLAPHRWYGPALSPEIVGHGAREPRAIHALAHVTGGGIAGNLIRVLPEGMRARIRSGSWSRPPLFRWLIETGAIPEEDARTALNLGVGLVIVCDRDAAPLLAERLARHGETVHVIGDVVAGSRAVEWFEE